MKAPIEHLTPRPKRRRVTVDFGKQGPGARQEFAADADVKTILKRHGGIPAGRQPTFFEVDYDLDLQTSLAVAKDAREAFNRIPLKLRRQYGTWEQILAALETKKIEIVDGKLRAVMPTESTIDKKEAPAVPPIPPAPPAAK